jgi:hypothetical protein
VRVETKDKVAVEINGGTVDRGDMARVDVFRKKNRKGAWEFHVIPIYPHQIVALESPPNRAVIAYKAENDWTSIDSSFEFAGLFSWGGNMPKIPKEATATFKLGHQGRKQASPACGIVMRAIDRSL